MRQHILFAGAAVAAITSAAMAADPDYSVSATWTGLYGGLHAGVIGAEFNNDVPVFAGPTDEAASFIGGVQAGYNWQTGSIVFGVEVDASIMGIEASSAGGSFDEDMMASARLRLGHAFDNYLVYLTAGIAGTAVDTGFTGLPSDEEFVAGFTGGAGVAMMIGDGWSGRLEYLYVNVPVESYAAGGAIHGGSDNHILRAGLDYHFQGRLQ